MMSLGLSASVLVVPLLLIQGSSSNTVLNGIINTNTNDSLTAYEVSGTTATMVISEGTPHLNTQSAGLTTVVNDINSKLHPQADTLAYESISSVVPADQIVANQTALPDTLIAPAHPVLPPPPPPPPPKPVYKPIVQTVVHYVAPAPTYSNSRVGPASWYAAPFGTCANTWLPFGTVVKIINLGTGATTTCRVEDRGPYVGGRILDMSEGTFAQVASTSQGVINIKMEW